MKTIALIALATTLVGCASVPTHCVRNGALAGGLAATAGYVVADNSGTRHRYYTTSPSTGEQMVSYYTTGKAYENRGTIAATTGITTAAITTMVCAARQK